MSIRMNSFKSLKRTAINLCFLALALSISTLAVATSVTWTGNQIEGCSPGGGCESSDGTDCDNGTPQPAATSYPIYLKRGSVIERATDVSLPGITFGWSHSRSYDSALDATSGTYFAPNGEKWFGGISQMYILESGGGIVFYSDASSKRTFTWNGSSYDSPDSYDATLEKVFDGPADRFELTHHPSGRMYIFYGFNSSNNTYEKGKLKTVTSVDFEEAGEDGIEYHYQSDDRVDYIVVSQGWYIDYEYLTSGSESGRLNKIEVYNDTTDVGNTPIKTVEYTYYGEESYYASSDIGSTGDLVEVKVTEEMSDGNDEVRITQYRYDQSHRITHIFEPDAIDRLLNDGMTSITTSKDILYKDNDYGTGSSTTSEVEDFASRSFTYYTFDDGTTDAETLWELSTENLESKYGGSSLDETGFVKSETINANCSSCGGAGASGMTYHYYYMNKTSGSNNDPSMLVVEDKVGSGTNQSPVLRVVYGLNDDGRLVRKATINDPYLTTQKVWCTSIILDVDDKISELRMPSAHDVDSSTDVKNFLDSDNDSTVLNGKKIVRPNDGLIYTFEYNTNGYQEGVLVQRGSGSGMDPVTAYYISGTDYGNGTTVAKHLPTASYRYLSKTTSRTSTTLAEKTSYTYTFWGSSISSIKTRKTTLPNVGTSRNGSGIAAKVWEYFDDRGRLRWRKDGEENVSYFSYHPDLGSLAYQMTDVETDDLPTDISNGSSGKWIAWSVAAPSNFGNTEPDNLQIVQKFEYDDHGRRTKYTDGKGFDHFTYYEVDRTISFPYWNDAAGVKAPERPITIVETDAAGRTTDVVTMKSSTTTASAGTPYVPTGVSNDLSLADTLSWTRYNYDSVTGVLDSVDKFHDIPTGTRGTTSTTISHDFYRTIFQYDNLGRQEYSINVITGSNSNASKEQVTKVIYDVVGRPIEIQKGVSPETGTNSDMGTNRDTNYPTLETVSKTEYDEGGEGDGYVTRIKNFYDSGDFDYTGKRFHRTYRGHLRGIEPIYASGSTELSIGPFTIMDLNWQGQVTATALYDTEPTWTAAGLMPTSGNGSHYGVYAFDVNNDTIEATNRRTISTVKYDDYGRPYETRKYEINITSGEGKPGEFLESNTYYNRNSQVVATLTEHNAATEIAYDGAGRRYQSRVVKALQETRYSSGAFHYNKPTPDPSISEMENESDPGDEGVLSMEHTVLDENGNSTEQHHFEVIAIETDMDPEDGILLSGSTTRDYIWTTSYSWYDSDSDELKTTANYGSGGNDWKYYSKSTPSEPPGSTSDRLVSKLTWTDGRVEKTTNPKGIHTKFTYDDLGRVIKTEKHDGATDPTDEIHLLVDYDGLSNVTKRIADNERNDNTHSNGSWTTNGSQITIYGFDDAVHATLPTTITHPDNQGTSDRVDIVFNLDGTPSTRDDQNGSTITFTYNNRRQLESQKVTAFGAEVDDTVKGIEYVYDDLSRLQGVRSHNSTSFLTSTIVNEVQYEYDDMGMVTTSYQSNSGAVNTSTTPKVQYGYDAGKDTGSSTFNNGYRLNQITYPDGTAIKYEYGSSGSIADYLNRIETIENSTDSEDLVEYYYTGSAGRLVEANYPTPGIKLTYSESSDYDGLDRFGRVTDQKWIKTSTVKDEFEYEYDYSSNPTVREVVTVADSPKSQTYSYDDHDRLLTYDQGIFDGTDIDDPNIVKNWELDELGNWTKYQINLPTDSLDVSFDGSSDLNQERLHNKANELDDDEDHADNSHIDVFSLNASAHMDQVDWMSVLATSQSMYDANGNLIGSPRPGDEKECNWYKYDAWNRLVEVWEDGDNGTRDLASDDTQIAAYEYDGLGRRIKHENIESSETYYYYYSVSWQVLEVRTEDMGTEVSNPLHKHVWHPYYIDALAVDYYDVDHNGSMGIPVKTYFFSHDANYNITAAFESDGDVRERYEYTAYGEVSYLNGDSSSEESDGNEWTDDSDQISDIENERLFTGHQRDSNTKLYHIRMRSYSPTIGRFIQKDPVGSWNDFAVSGNAFSYGPSSPLRGSDPTGTVWIKDPFNAPRWKHLAQFDQKLEVDVDEPFSFYMRDPQPDGCCVEVTLQGTKSFTRELHAEEERWIDVLDEFFKQNAINDKNKRNSKRMDESSKKLLKLLNQNAKFVQDQRRLAGPSETAGVTFQIIGATTTGAGALITFGGISAPAGAIVAGAGLFITGVGTIIDWKKTGHLDAADHIAATIPGLLNSLATTLEMKAEADRRILNFNNGARWTTQWEWRLTGNIKFIDTNWKVGYRELSVRDVPDAFCEQN